VLLLLETFFMEVIAARGLGWRYCAGVDFPAIQMVLVDELLAELTLHKAIKDVGRHFLWTFAAISSHASTCSE
jgi:hypothetical protein